MLIYNQLICDKGTKNIHWGKEAPSIKATCERRKMDYLPIQHTKVNSKRIKDLNVNPKTIKYKGEKNTGNIYALWHGSQQYFFGSVSWKTDLSFRITEIEKRVQNCHCAYLTYMQSTLHKMPGWMKHKLESRLPEDISITSDMQMTPPLWQKVKSKWRASWWK